MSGQRRKSDWITELKARLAPLSLVIFAGLVKNAGKTTALNWVNKLFPDQTIGLTSLGYDGEEKDALYFHPKPPVFVHNGQLLLTGERFLPPDRDCYEVLDSWGDHPQFGPWLVVRITRECAFRMAGPVSLAEQQKGIMRLMRWGAERILIDGALNRLSHISLMGGSNGGTGVVLSSGSALGNSFEEAVQRTGHWLELFNLPLLSGESFSSRQDINMQVVPPLPGGAERNSYFSGGKWVFLPPLLWEYNSGEMLPADIQALYLAGALTDALYLNLRKAKRLPAQLVLRSPANCLLSPRIWEGLKARNIKVKLLERPNLVMLTLNPWHPLKPVPTEEMAEALLPYCPVPIVDIQKQRIWLPET